MQFLYRLSYLLAEVPDVVWSGVIAAVLTLSGVLISNRSNTIRFLRQLEHDANEKDKQRKFDLRNEVYLDAIEQVVHVNAFLASLPALDLKGDNPVLQMEPFFVAAAKLQLISEQETSILVNQVVSEYFDVLCIVLRQLSIISPINADIEHGEEFGFDSPEVKSSLYQERSDFHVSFARLMLDEKVKLTRKTLDVMVALRGELNVGSNIDEFARQLDIQHQRMKEAFETLLSS